MDVADPNSPEPAAAADPDDELGHGAQHRVARAAGRRRRRGLRRPRPATSWSAAPATTCSTATSRTTSSSATTSSVLTDRLDRHHQPRGSRPSPARCSTAAPTDRRARRASTGHPERRLAPACSLVDGAPRTYRRHRRDASRGGRVLRRLSCTPHGRVRRRLGAGAGSFGNDYIAGGAADDVLFGQLGNDIIQGDGGIEVRARRDLARRRVADTGWLRTAPSATRSAR